MESTLSNGKIKSSNPSNEWPVLYELALYLVITHNELSILFIYIFKQLYVVDWVQHGFISVYIFHTIEFSNNEINNEL